MDVDASLFAILVVVFLLLVRWFWKLFDSNKSIREEWEEWLISIFDDPDDPEWWQDLDQEDEDDKKNGTK